MAKKQGTAQKPRRWNGREDAMACIECEKEFVKGDLVFEDCVVTIHAGCAEAYKKTLVKIRKGTL